MTLDAVDRSRTPPGAGDTDSRSTLEGNGNDRGEKSEIDRSEDKRNGDEENSDVSPLPVGFWDASLNKVRLEVLKNWAFTSQCPFLATERESANQDSPVPLRLHLDRSVAILGGSVSR